MTTPIDIHNADGIVLALYDSVATVLKSDDIDAIANAVAALDTLKREIGEIYDQAKTTLADLMGAAPEYATTRYSFEKKMGSSRKAWDHRALVTVVADRLASMSIDLDTGEVLKTPTEMIAEAFDFAGVSYWRVKELQRIGVNADSYCEVLDGKPSIIVRPLSDH